MTLLSSIQFDRAVRLFGEDSAGVQPDEFFGIFENFLQALTEARQDVENMRKKIEEDERRAKQEQEVNHFISRLINIFILHDYILYISLVV